MFDSGLVNEATRLLFWFFAGPQQPQYSVKCTLCGLRVLTQRWAMAPPKSKDPAWPAQT